MTSTPPTTDDTVPAPPPQRRPTWSQVTAVGIMVVTVAALGGFLLGRVSAGPAAPAATAAPPAVATAVPTSSLGDPDAPVTIVEYSDFRCPYCQRHATTTGPDLIARYVDAGLVRLEWRDYPALGPMSVQLAVAGRAAEQQGRFWAFHDAVFARSDQIEGVADVRAVAVDVGLDLTAFDAAMADPALELAVRRSLDEARALGVTGTPAFTVDGQPIRGAQPLDTFVQAIESALGTAAPGESAADTPAAPTTVSPDEAAELLAVADDLQVLDVRTAEETATGTIAPQVVTLDFYADTFAQDLLATLDRDRPVLVYCRTGNRSGQTARFLAAQGFEVLDLDGGVAAWQDAGLPLS